METQRPARKVDRDPDRTSEHDDVYNEFEHSPLIDHNGAPINFKQTRFDLDASSRLMDMALTKSRFIALLTSRHISFTHGQDPLAAGFIKALKNRERTWLKEAGAQSKELDMAYELLEFCDAFSLLICQFLIPPEGRRMEISCGPDGTSYSLFQQGDKIIVEPWPFAVEHFQVYFETRTIDRLQFTGDRQFRKMLKACTIENLRLTIAQR